jgi:hypothetical protein
MSRSEQRRIDAATKYLELRGSAGRDVESRRAVAAAEASLASELRDGRMILDDGTEVSVRAGGRVRVREPRTGPTRDERRALRHGYTGDSAELGRIGKEIRDAIRGLTRGEMDELRSHYREVTASELALVDDDDDMPVQARTAKPTPPAIPTGWQKDGNFHVTRSQLRDASFTQKHQADISKAGMAEKLKIIEEA